MPTIPFHAPSTNEPYPSAWCTVNLQWTQLSNASEKSNVEFLLQGHVVKNHWVMFSLSLPDERTKNSLMVSDSPEIELTGSWTHRKLNSSANTRRNSMLYPSKSIVPLMVVTKTKGGPCKQGALGRSSWRELCTWHVQIVSCRRRRRRRHRRAQAQTQTQTQLQQQTQTQTQTKVTCAFAFPGLRAVC